MSRTTKATLALVVACAVSISCWVHVAMPKREKIPMDDQSRVEFVDVEGASENSRIIAELQKSVDILDKSVAEALERAEYRVRNIRFVPVVVTAYNPVVAQTDSTPTITASNKRVRPGIVALSRDLEKEFGFKFGDTVVIEDHGSFVFEDRMNKRWTRRVDILMFSWEDARKFGAQRSFLVVSY